MGFLTGLAKRNIPYNQSLWESNAKPLVKSALTRARAIKRDGYNREMETRYMYYRGEQEMLLRQDLMRYFKETYPTLHPVFLPILEQIIKRLANIYCGPASRTLKVDSTGDVFKNKNISRLVERVYERARIDCKMQQADRFAELFGVAILKVVWRRDHVEVDVIAPFSFEYDADPADQLWLDSRLCTVYVDLPMPWDKSLGYSITDRGEIVHQSYDFENRYEIWTNDEIATFEGTNKIGESQVNPYGEKPFISIHREISDEMFPLTSQDLVACQRAINLWWCDIFHGSRFSVWPDSVVTGRVNKKTLQNLATGPEFIKSIPEGSSYQKISVDPGLDKLINAAVSFLKVFAQSKNLGSDLFTLDPRAVSGVAKMNDLRNLIEDRKAKIPRWVYNERELFRKIRLVHNTHSAEQIPQDLDIDVEFSEMYIPQDRLQEIQTVERELALNLSDPIDTLQRRRRITRSAARTLHDRFKKTNQSEDVVVSVKAALKVSDNDSNLSKVGSVEKRNENVDEI